MSQSESVKSKPLWRSTLALSLMAAVFTAFYKTMDNITVHNFIVAEDGLTAAFAYLVIGGWTGAISGILFSLLLGKKLIDPSFNRIVFKNGRMHSQALISGAISAGATLFILWGNQLGDPGMLIALGNGVLFYTAVYDLITKQARYKEILIPTALVVAGGAMAAFGGSLRITLMGFLLVIVVSNGLFAVGEVVEQKGIRASDSVNLFLWRFFWLAATGTLLAFSVSALRGYMGMFLLTLRNGISYIPWITLLMFFVFLGIGLKFAAKKDDAVTKVLIGLSPQIILGYLITWLGNWISPGLFGKIPTDVWVWTVRVVGSSLMVWGIFRLRKDNSS